MSCTLSKIMIFAAGAAIGSAVTWKIVKTKYEQLSQVEIDDVRVRFSKRLKELEDKKTYEDLARGYSEESRNYNAHKEIMEEVNCMDDIRVILPEEYGDNIDEYEPTSLTYYADGVLADDMDEIIEDVDGVVGSDSLTRFGENLGDEDTVYVRNDRTKRDYEIMRDTRNYSDVVKLYCPRPVEG